MKNIEWGEYELGKLFEIKSNPQLNKESFVFDTGAEYPYFTRTVFNNGILGYVNYLDEEHKIKGNCLAVGMIGMQFFYIEKDFYAGQFTKRAVPKSFTLNHNLATYFISILNKNEQKYKNVLVRDFERVFNETKIYLPSRDGKIDFEFMENFMIELESKQISKINTYLQYNGLTDYELTGEEQKVLDDFKSIQWGIYNLEELYGKSTRGKRLKSSDRIQGDLPFVTAGETDEGVSAFIGNSVDIFSENTTTIDMFGSAKYRSYKYGADDHIAVVHTEKLHSLASVFVTTAIHKSSYNGQFNYGRNFYAKDADELNISLPTKQGKPDYNFMQTLISAIQKLVIKDVILYVDGKTKAKK